LYQQTSPKREYDVTNIVASHTAYIQLQ